MKKILQHQTRRKFTLFALFTGILLSSLALLIYLNNFKVSERVMVNETHKRQIVIAKSAAKQIELFLKAIKYQVGTLNQIEEVASLDETKTRKIFEDLVSNFSDVPTISIARIDHNGKMIILSNKYGVRTGEGESFSDREYFIWAKNPLNKDKIYVSSPFISRAGSSKGKYIINFSTPSYYKNNFTGLTHVNVSLQELDNFFIDSIRINTLGNILLVGSDGKVISGSKDLINYNLFDYANNNHWEGFDKFIETYNEALLKEEGSSKWFFKYPGKDQISEEIVSFKKITINGENWHLFITNPTDILDTILIAFNNNQKYLLLIIIFSTIIAGLLIVLSGLISHRDGFLKGYQKALEELKEKI